MSTAQERWGEATIRELPAIPIPELGDVLINPDRAAEEATALAWTPGLC